MQKRSAEVVVVNNCKRLVILFREALMAFLVIRYVFAAASSAFVLPLSDAIGWGLPMTIAANISVGDILSSRFQR